MTTNSQYGIAPNDVYVAFAGTAMTVSFPRA